MTYLTTQDFLHMVTTLEMGSAWLRHTEEERGKINKAFEPEEKSEKQD